MTIAIRDRIVEFRKIRASELKSNPDNWRAHPDEQADALQASLEEIGNTTAVGAFYDEAHELMLFDGHLRQRLMPEVELWVGITDLTPEEGLKILLTHHRIGALATVNVENLERLYGRVRFDSVALQAMANELAAANNIPQIPTSALPRFQRVAYRLPLEDRATVTALERELEGAAGLETARATARAGLDMVTQEQTFLQSNPIVSRADELQKKWGTATVQIWEIGQHRLICGDCTDPVAVDSLMSGCDGKAHLCFTSPPYNVDSDLGGKKKFVAVKGQKSGNKYATDDNHEKKDFLAFLVKFTRLALVHAHYVFVNIQALAGNKIALTEYVHQFANQYADVIIWDKQNAQPAMANNVLNSRFEFVFVFSQKANRSIGTKKFRGTIDNVVQMSPYDGKEFSDIHKATFPVAFAAYFVDNFTNEGEVVYEPFSGVGSTFVACEKSKRRCFGVEIEPKYVAVILERMETLGEGITPRLIETIVAPAEKVS